MCPYSKVDEAKRFLESFLLSVPVVGVGLFVELRHVGHHLGHKSNISTLEIGFPPPLFKRRRLYLVLVGEPPDPSSHLHGKDEEKEEEELVKTGEARFNARKNLPDLQPFTLVL